MSTSDDPCNTGARFGMFSDTQPATQQAGANLLAVFCAATSSTNWKTLIAPAAYRLPALESLTELAVTSAGPSKVSAGRLTPYVPTSDQAAHINNLSSSAAANALLAAADFWAATRVAGSGYVDGVGIADMELALDFQVGSVGQRWVHAVRATNHTDYLASARKVVVLKNNAPFELRLRAAVEVPQYLFALQLGFDATTVVCKPATCLLLDIVPAVVTVAVQRLKHIAQAKRPSELIVAAGGQALQPAIPTPEFTAYPGGHAAVAYAMAGVLAEATGANLPQLESLSAQIAQDREDAGIHSSIDTARGIEIGRVMAQWMLRAADRPVAFGAWSGVFASAAIEWNP